MNLPKDIDLSKKTLGAIRLEKKVPQGELDTYAAMFEAHRDKLQNIRTSLEDMQASEEVNEAELTAAKAVVVLLRKDVAAWAS
eukprot:6837815-Alexandrium_andersonii.AAC.1